METEFIPEAKVVVIGKVIVVADVMVVVGIIVVVSVHYKDLDAPKSSKWPSLSNNMTR